MPPSRPYQPALLRILHGTTAILTVLALVSGFWVYNTYDKRWGSLALPKLPDIQGIHGTIALTFLLILPFLALYSFHIGYGRLAPSFNPLQQIGKPIWWHSLQRFANTFMLLAVTFAAVTGRMMNEAWLPAGEIHRSWYLAHLVAWICVLSALVFHLLLGVKVGGVSLLSSMFHWDMRHQDRPRSWLKGIKIKPPSLILKILEGVVIGGIIMAFILPIFNT